MDKLTKDTLGKLMEESFSSDELKKLNKERIIIKKEVNKKVEKQKLYESSFIYTFNQIETKLKLLKFNIKTYDNSIQFETNEINSKELQFYYNSKLMQKMFNLKIKPLFKFPDMIVLIITFEQNKKYKELYINDDFYMGSPT